MVSISLENLLKIIDSKKNFKTNVSHALINTVPADV